MTSLYWIKTGIRMFVLSICMEILFMWVHDVWLHLLWSSLKQSAEVIFFYVGDRPWTNTHLPPWILYSSPANCLLYRKLKLGVILRKALCRETSQGDTTSGGRHDDFSPIFTVFHTICPEWAACHPQGGGWQATRPVSRVKWLWRLRQTRRNGNVARLDSSNFPTFTSEKYLLGEK